MEGSSDLDNALQRRHESEQKERTARELFERELAVEREKFAQEEAAVKAELFSVIDQAVAKLRDRTPNRIPIGPKPYGLGRLIRRQDYVEGWRIDFGTHGNLLCPDGRLVTAYNAGKPRYSSLWQLVEEALRSTHDGPFSEVPTSSPWGEAFSPTCRLERHPDVASAQAEMRARLAEKKAGLIEHLAAALYQCGVRSGTTGVR